MKTIFLQFFFLLAVSAAFAQDTTGITVRQIVYINNEIEKAVRDKNVTALDTLIGNDLLFSHGGGNVDNKNSYLARVPRSNYVSRTVDSTHVEVHRDAALVTGRVIVVNGGEKPKPTYGIKYVRLYSFRNERWVLVSHRTIQKWDEQK
jgi:hypothetical protein